MAEPGSTPAERETTDNAFLGGRLELLQPKDGYRAGVDPVLLAASVTPKPRARVLDLGCGVGTALYCLGVRVPNLSLTGVELLAAHADLAQRNAERNGLKARIITADIAELPPDLRQESFDVILANPPFFDRTSTSASPNASREAGRGVHVPLDIWIDVAAKRLAPKGQLAMIARAEMVPEMLAAASGRLGSLILQPFVPREGRAPHLVILKATKSGRAAFKIAPQLVLHRGTAYAGGEDYTDAIAAVLRKGAALRLKC